MQQQQTINEIQQLLQQKILRVELPIVQMVLLSDIFFTPSKEKSISLFYLKAQVPLKM
ncbi:MAG: hypothetical protein WKF97_05390 [Chitinophagaceae bacterium]